MEMIDMRKLTPEARQERRRQVIKLRRSGWDLRGHRRRSGPLAHRCV